VRSLCRAFSDRGLRFQNVDSQVFEFRFLITAEAVPANLLLLKRLTVPKWWQSVPILKTGPSSQNGWLL